MKTEKQKQTNAASQRKRRAKLKERNGCYHCGGLARPRKTLCSSCAKRQQTIGLAYRPTRYGISVAEYSQQAESQEGVCAICFSPETIKGRKGLAIDHDHDTGKIRGLLCGNCNSILGLAEDSIPRLRSAIAYLKRGGVM